MVKDATRWRQISIFIVMLCLAWRMVNDVYPYLAKNSSAETVVSQYYKEHNPFIVTQDKREYTVQFEIRSIVRSGSNDKSWPALWSEEKMDQGTIIERTDWRAIISIAT